MRTTTTFAVIATIVSILTNQDVLSLACPTMCICQGEKNVNQVICKFKQLTGVPDDLPSNATALDLHGNWISSLANVFHNFTEVQILDLSFNDIRALGSQDLTYMNNLRHLNLQGNRISHLSENVFQALPWLEIINLSNNSLTSINGTSFAGLRHLYSLNLRDNLIKELTEDSYSFPESLTLLDLSENTIRELSNVSFYNLHQLQVLNLQYNSIEVLDGKSFPEYNNLTELDVSHNSITMVVSGVSLSGILVLDLSSNNITDSSNLDLDYCTSLVNLTLDNNPLVSVSDPVFSTLHSLQYLSLSNMPKLTYLSKSMFDGLMNLTELNLSYNSLMSFIHKELFRPLPHISIINLSFNNITTLYKESFQTNTRLTELNLTGNHLTCDCGIAWILHDIENRSSSLVNREYLDCVMPNSNETLPMMQLEEDSLFCGDVKIVNHSGDSAFKIGHPAILKCEAESSPSPEIVWITPRERIFQYHDFHAYATLDYLPFNTSLAHFVYQHTHTPEEQPSYYSISETDPNRIVVLEDGSLYIDYVMRSDAGPYRCIARNPRNSSQVVINVTLDYKVLQQTYLWSLVVGSACAASFFVLNLTYSLTLAGIRRCISQRRRERIRQIIESMDQYKTQRLGRIKENYHHQVGRIRDQYHYQLGRLREHHQSQMGRMGRMREGASQKVEKLRENYNNQLGRLKEYSSDQLSQIRERYNNQIDKIKDYGSDKMYKIHEKYKLKQQHVIRLLEMMNLENCRTVFETECVRTESMILQSDIFTSDIPIHSPIDSVSVSESEYMTASSSESSKYNSQENVNETGDSGQEKPTSIHPYLPDTDSDQLLNEESESFSDPLCDYPNSSPNKSDTNTPQRHGKRGSNRRSKRERKIKLDPISQLAQQSNELTQVEESADTTNSGGCVWERNSDTDQMRPLLVRSHDQEPSENCDSNQGLLQDNGAEVSHVVVDMPPVSVDNIRETIV